ncbi:MAG TPA: hypothetical protein VML75_22750 [Kofleriaceae bacterium]|nr:hypothetical protein [Kofleriaceae bacterium]
MVLARWTAHPARHRPRDIALVVAVVLLTMGAVLTSLESAFLAVLAAAVIVVSVAPFLFPTHYALTDEGVEERRLWTSRARRWKDLRRVEVGRAAVLVSPLARKSWLDRYRGVILYLDGADRDQVVRILTEHVPARAA